MPTVLVTGATGMAGRYVVPALLDRGFTVRGRFCRQPGSAKNVEWRQMDFLKSVDCRRLVEGCDGVVHLAAELHDIKRMQRVNVDATRALMNAAQSMGVRYFGFASSIVTYGSPRRRWVDEGTPLLDPNAPMVRQYHAEPYMLEYARTKTLAELALFETDAKMTMHIYRPGVVADLNRLLEAAYWSEIRKVMTSYRRTQYIFAPDAAAAIGHLVVRGLVSGPPAAQAEAFNVCDHDCGVFADLMARAYRATGNRRFRVRAHVPILPDLAKDLLKYRDTAIRYPLGMLTFSNAKLLATGFVFPVGMKAALQQALTQRPMLGSEA
nr:NAD-dependent epimerase/dehydratase family protein [uncultured Rhodopila sp.]